MELHYKRSNSCSDIIYDVMSDDEETGTNSVKAVIEGIRDSLSDLDDVIYDDVSHEDDTQDHPYTTVNNGSLNLEDSQKFPPPLLPKSRTTVDRIRSLSDLKDRLPVVIEVVEGICDEDDKNNILTEDKLVVFSRGSSSLLTCINMKGQVFNIPITPDYHIALMPSDTKLNSKIKETVKSILDMKAFPNQIIANTEFEIDGVSVIEGQILEVSQNLDRSAKYLRVQTLSGEEIELPRSLKNSFSCSISSVNVSLPLAIETCVFPQQVVLTDKTSRGRTRKMVCTILDSFIETFFEVCEYKGDIQSSLNPHNPVIKLPIDYGITFKIIERPTTLLSPFDKPNLEDRRHKTVSRDVTPVKVRPPTATKPSRSNSFSAQDCNRVSKEIRKLQNPDPHRSLDSRVAPAPVKNKPIKMPRGRFDKKAMIHELRSISLEKVSNFEDTGPSKVTAPKETKHNKTPKGKVNNEQTEENKKLKETISSLEASLSQKERESIELKLKLDLLENALSEANKALAIERKRTTQLEMKDRSLPSIPDQGQRPAPIPISPIYMSPQFPHKPKVLQKTPPTLTAKPKLDSKCRSNLEQDGTEEGKHTIHYLGTVLDKVNLTQYKEAFSEHGINMEVFLELDEEVLENELGVKAVLHRKKLLRLAARMKNNEDISHFFVDAQYSRVQTKKKDYEYM